LAIGRVKALENHSLNPIERVAQTMTTELRTPADLQKLIHANQIAATILQELGDTPTVPDAARALGIETDQIIKTLLFLVDQSRSGGVEAPAVVISHGERRVAPRLLAAHFGVAGGRVKLASAPVVLHWLGYPAGGVPPFGHKTTLPVILDASVLDAAERFGGTIYGGGGDHHTMLRLTVAELIRVLQPAIAPMSEEVRKGG
jgi:prolyl-tRNA editing enzyme YbaK/EbsC (Cys-tRNA(Pro) deacylase)